MTYSDRQPIPPPPLHQLEAEVMAVVWHHDAITVREVFEHLNAQAARQRAYTTFMTVMRRLAAKGVLERRREGKTDIYCAALTAEEYAAARARAGVGALVDEFGELALAHFAAAVRELDPERRAKLEQLASDD